MAALGNPTRRALSVLEHVTDSHENKKRSVSASQLKQGVLLFHVQLFWFKTCPSFKGARKRGSRVVPYGLRCGPCRGVREIEPGAPQSVRLAGARRQRHPYSSPDCWCCSRCLRGPL